MKASQSGLSLISMILVALFICGALLLGFKSFGAYGEYYALQRILGQVAEEGTNGATDIELRKSFGRRANIDRIESVKANDLRLHKEGGKVVIDVEYNKVVPLVGNVSLLFDFKVSTKK